MGDCCDKGCGNQLVTTPWLLPVTRVTLSKTSKEMEDNRLQRVELCCNFVL